MGDCSHDASFPIWKIFWEHNRRLMKTWYCGFIGFLIKNAHLPSYNTMSLMFNAFIASSLCPYNKHNGTANFFDKSFKVKLYSKLLR